MTLLGLHLLATSKVVMLQTLQIGARWLPVLSGHLLFLQCSAWGSSQRLGVVSSVQPFCWLWAVSAALPLPDAAKPGMFLLIHDTTGQEYDAEDLRFGCSSVAGSAAPWCKKQAVPACMQENGLARGFNLCRDLHAARGPAFLLCSLIACH